MDCQIVFGTARNNIQTIPDAREQAEMTKNEMTAWATFAKDPETGLEELGRPMFDPKRSLLPLSCAQLLPIL